MKTIQEICDMAIAAGVKKSITEKLKLFIDTGEEDKAWSTALGGWRLLQYFDIASLAELQSKTKTALVFYDNGKLASRAKYVNCQLNGLFEEFYENGNLESKVYFEGDQQWGEYIGYWKNGNIARRGNYRNGSHVGIWEYFAEDGTFQTQTDFDFVNKKSQEIWREVYSNQSFNRRF